MIQIVPGTASSNSGAVAPPEEKLYIKSTLGFTFRHFEGLVEAATVQFTGLAHERIHCEIEGDVGWSAVIVEATGTSRTAAFMQCMEQLDRRMHEASVQDTGRSGAQGSSDSIAA